MRKSVTPKPSINTHCNLVKPSLLCNPASRPLIHLLPYLLWVFCVVLPLLSLLSFDPNWVFRQSNAGLVSRQIQGSLSLSLWKLSYLFLYRSSCSATQRACLAISHSLPPHLFQSFSSIVTPSFYMQPATSHFPSLTNTRPFNQPNTKPASQPTNHPGDSQPTNKPVCQPVCYQFISKYFFGHSNCSTSFRFPRNTGRLVFLNLCSL